MKIGNKKIAVVIFNYIQYLSIMPGIEKLIEKGYDIDFYCDEAKGDETGFYNLFADVRNALLQKGHKVYTKSQKIKYKILLEPYINGLGLEGEYNLRYRYGPITAKPNKVYIPSFFIKYDCVLCSGTYEARLLSNFTNTEILADLKYVGFKKKNYHKGKKVLLYLPTYGEESSIELILNELKKLRKKYYIIAKIHHGTSFLKNESERSNLIKDAVDEYYDSHKELKDLLEISDIVLTDNSASIFEALYNNIPVATFSNDINQNKIGDFNSIQYELYKEGLLPYTNNTRKIKDILEETLSKKIVLRQRQWSKKNLVYSKDPIGDFVKIIEKYYTDKIDRQTYLLHRLLRSDYDEKVDKLDGLTKECEKLHNELNSCVNELKNYRTGKLYKIATRIYKIKNGGKK